MRAYTSTGFTLLEMLISISVVSVVLVGASNVSELGFQHLERSRDRQLASQFASSHFAVLEQEKNLTIGTSSGSYSERFQWQLRLEKLTIEEQKSTSYQLTPVAAYLSIFSSTGTSEYHSLFLRRKQTTRQETDQRN